MIQPTTVPEEPDPLNALEQLDAWLRNPMLVLSFPWLALVVVELIWGWSRLLEVFGTAIWIVFIIEFTVRLALALMVDRYAAHLSRLRFLADNGGGSPLMLPPLALWFSSIRLHYGKLCFVLRWTRRSYASGGNSRYTRHRYLASRDQAAAP
jgi:hypothetical protein